METEIKKTKIDELGRVTLPTDLREIFDRLKIDINAEDFKDYHRLKAKMLSGK